MHSLRKGVPSRLRQQPYSDEVNIIGFVRFVLVQPSDSSLPVLSTFQLSVH